MKAGLFSVVIELGTHEFHFTTPDLESGKAGTRVV